MADDDDVVQDTWITALADAGYRALGAANGHQAVDLMAAVIPDLMIDEGAGAQLAAASVVGGAAGRMPGRIDPNLATTSCGESGVDLECEMPRFPHAAGVMQRTATRTEARSRSASGSSVIEGMNERHHALAEEGL